MKQANLWQRQSTGNTLFTFCLRSATYRTTTRSGTSSISSPPYSLVPFSGTPGTAKTALASPRQCGAGRPWVNLISACIPSQYQYKCAILRTAIPIRPSLHSRDLQVSFGPVPVERLGPFIVENLTWLKTKSQHNTGLSGRKPAANIVCSVLERDKNRRGQYDLVI